jgi:hypothetical protein
MIRWSRCNHFVLFHSFSDSIRCLFFCIQHPQDLRRGFTSLVERKSTHAALLFTPWRYLRFKVTSVNCAIHRVSLSSVIHLTVECNQGASCPIYRTGLDIIACRKSCWGNTSTSHQIFIEVYILVPVSMLHLNNEPDRSNDLWLASNLPLCLASRRESLPSVTQESTLIRLECSDSWASLVVTYVRVCARGCQSLGSVPSNIARLQHDLYIKRKMNVTRKTVEQKNWS